jgi:hypothetical protein
MYWGPKEKEKKNSKRLFVAPRCQIDLYLNIFFGWREEGADEPAGGTRMATIPLAHIWVTLVPMKRENFWIQKVAQCCTECVWMGVTVGMDRNGYGYDGYG